MNNFKRLLESEYYHKAIYKGNIYDISFPGTDSSDGWKLSIQGKTVEDIIFVYDKLSKYLEKEQIAFKVATIKRLNHPDKEQSKKIMTIYVPNDYDKKELAEKIYKKIKNYKGWHNIKTPTGYKHYAGGIFYRNDRDSKGNYIPIKKL